MNAILPGFLTGFSLIVAIGAQNAFILRQGLTRRYVFLIVTICALSDALLISLGTFGLGALIQAIPHLLDIIRWLGVAYLVWFGSTAVRKALMTNSLTVADETQVSLKKTLLLTLGFTFLNPHVYLDTVILVGGVANQFGENKWFFALGAIAASLTWFFSLGLAASKLAVVMAKPIFWKILDIFIAAVMFSLAINLAAGELN
ncbi:MAG: amino acid transporter [Micrococcales bacterium]|nr:amino acid transporter [Actinomycetota bacterium]NCA08275.1 amino acid transporter [Micrococcales bacterium]